MKYKPTELCLYTNDRNPDLYCERKCVLRSSGFIPNVVLRLFSNSPQIAPHCPQILPDCPQIVSRLCSDCPLPLLRFSPIVLRLSLDSAQIAPRLPEAKRDSAVSCLCKCTDTCLLHCNTDSIFTSNVHEVFG